MSESSSAKNWTPGPWFFSVGSRPPENDTIARIHVPSAFLHMDMHENGYVSANRGFAQTGVGISRDETIANAHLIAAAPELYEALEWVLQEHRVMNPAWSGIENIKAVLSKARGSQ